MGSSLPRTWFLGQVVKALDFQSSNRGSESPRNYSGQSADSAVQPFLDVLQRPGHD